MAKRRPGLRNRLDQLQGQANATMNQAQASTRNVEAAVVGLIEELLDGITLELTVAGRRIPVQLKILPREDE